MPVPRLDAITLKPATGQDLAFACRVAEAAMREYAVATFGKWDEAEVRQRSEENIRSGNLRIIERDGTPMGIQLVEREKDHIALQQIFLLPECQGTGVGSELVRRLMEESRASGLPLRLRVLRVNPAQRLYLRLGFRVVRMTDERYFMEYSAAASRRAVDSVRACDLPEASLLRKYQGEDGYADCYVVEVAGAVSQAEFVEAFYTTPLFKVERAMLGWFASRPSTDAQARQLANGSIDAFAAWRVEGRRTDQLLLADVMGRTRSWLMVAPIEGSAEARTRLYFGSAVVPEVDRNGKRTMGFVFRSLLVFHKLYSRALLASARSRLAGRTD
jgi:ribosomal protein S18 acetylase RimI-like enzyme